MLTLNSELKDKQYQRINIAVNIIALALILCSIGTVVYMQIVNRGLWLDEAFLAFSLCTRGWDNLTTEILDYQQTAPIGYLYLVKLSTLIFGVNEFALRFLSLISYFIVLFETYFISKKILKHTYPLILVAFVASLPFMMRYSNEFKPYMFDASLILLVFIVHYLFSNKKISIYLMLIFCATVFWFSSPVVFFLGGLFVYEFIHNLRKKNFRELKTYIIIGSITFISFVIYYFLWLVLVVDAGDLAKMWSLKRFPLIPTSFFDFYILKFIIYDIFIKFGPFRYLVLSLFFAMIFLNYFYLRSKFFYITYISILLICIASYLEKYPMHDRMCLFLFPIISIVFFHSLFCVATQLASKAFSYIVIVILFLVIIFSNVDSGILYYSDKNNEYETNYKGAITALESRINDDSTIYISDEFFPGYSFEKGFKDPNYAINHVETEDFIEALEKKETGDIYFLTSYLIKTQLKGHETLLNQYEVEKLYDNTREKLYRLKLKDKNSKENVN